MAPGLTAHTGPRTEAHLLSRPGCVGACVSFYFFIEDEYPELIYLFKSVQQDATESAHRTLGEGGGGGECVEVGQRKKEGGWRGVM